MLRDDPIIWLPHKPENLEQVLQFKPESYLGTCSEYQFLVIRYMDVAGEHFDGNVTHDSGAMVVLPFDLNKQLFELAVRKTNLNVSSN